MCWHELCRGWGGLRSASEAVFSWAHAAVCVSRQKEFSVKGQKTVHVHQKWLCPVSSSFITSW